MCYGKGRRDEKVENAVLKALFAFPHGCSLLVPPRYHTGLYTRVLMLLAYMVVIPFFLFG